MAKVYLLTAGWECDNVGVFSTREKAEAAMGDGDAIIEYEVDELGEHVVGPTHVAYVSKASGEIVREFSDHYLRHPSDPEVDDLEDRIRVASPISPEHARSEAIRLHREWLARR